METKIPNKITIGSELGKKANCSMCHKEGTTDQFFALRTKEKTKSFSIGKTQPASTIYLCSECREKTNKVFEEETKNPNYILGTIAGLAGALVGGLVWYFIAISAGWEFGYISIGLGYLVGTGVHYGSGKKRSHSLQGISAAITLIAIFVTEKFIFDHSINAYLQANLDKYPGAVGQVFSGSFFDATFLQSLVSPIGLVIYAIGIYYAYRLCQPRKI